MKYLALHGKQLKPDEGFASCDPDSLGFPVFDTQDSARDFADHSGLHTSEQLNFIAGISLDGTFNFVYISFMNLEEVKPKENFRLYLRYDDGASGEVDLSRYAGRGVFSAWLEPGVFEQVRLADAGHPEWPKGIDLCPDALYMQLTGKKPDEFFPALSHLPAHA